MKKEINIPSVSIEQIQNRIYLKAKERSEWINEQMRKNVPAWQRWLMIKTESKYLINKFGWKIKSYKYNELNSDVIEIWHKDKLIVSKIFEI